MAISSGVNTKAGSRRIIQFAFDYAVRNGRKKVTIVHKANVLKALTGVFLDAGREVARSYEGRVEMDDRIVDACAMQLVLNPWQFDVLVSTNLFGDILSDLVAGLVGGLGMTPGANIGMDAAIFEAVHGSAPDIAGQDVANPFSLILSAALLLSWYGRRVDDQVFVAAGAAIEASVADEIASGEATRDVGGRLSTSATAEGLAARIISGA